MTTKRSDGDYERRRQEAAREFLDVVATTTEHQDITKAQAVRQMLEAAIHVYDCTEKQYVADWARETLLRMDERGL
jgi:hypothetical protein